MTSQEGPWVPYRPTVQDPWNIGKVAHLHRRAGFGGTRAELQRDLRDGPATSVNRFLSPAEPTADERQIVEGLRQGVLSSNDSDRLKAWWLYRVLYDRDPLREKMTLFWHGHFATSNRKVRSVELVLRQNELFRGHALGEFATLLTDIIPDPAMLIWLDGDSNHRDRPNENFAREFLELFTLGPGNYTEVDIRQAARAFTGWVRIPGRMEEMARFRFEAEHFDDGKKTFLRRAGRWRPADVVRITLEQPATAEFLCRKLYRFFVREDAEPSAELIRPLAAEFRDNRYSIRHLLGVILRSRHFYAEAAHRQRIGSPVEYSAGILRMLEVPRSEVRLLALAQACDRQGQELFYPPNVRGWVGGRTWLNSTTVLERGNWANDVIWDNAELDMRPYDPAAWGRRYGVAANETAAALLDLLLQGNVTARARELILRTDLRRALQLALHCPEYQLV